MKKALTIFLSAFFICIMIAPMGTAAKGPALTTRVIEGEYSKSANGVESVVGTTFTIVVKAPAVKKLTGVNLYFEYDPAILKVKSAGFAADEDGTKFFYGLEAYGPISGRDNQYAFAWISSGAGGVSKAEATDLLYITFNVLDTSKAKTPVYLYIDEFFTDDDVDNDIMSTVLYGNNIVSFKYKPATYKPATPKVSTTNENGGVNVFWNEVKGAVKYVVYRRTAGSKTWVNIGSTTGTLLLDKNVVSGQYYCYSVRAYDAQGTYSNFVSANTQTRKFMATPNLTTIYNHVNGLAIKWNAVAGATNGYRVYRRGAGSTCWTYLGTTKNIYFIDNSVKYRSGEYFRYTVIADGGYHSKFDSTGLYLKRLANPTLLSATSTSTGITVKWDAVMGTTGYYVYRKTAKSSWTRIAAVGGTSTTTFLDKTAKKGTTYTYTVKAVYGTTTSSYYSGISCYDKY